ncbi:hypothetical protein EB796_007483 [Bugula neritina]|uniref:Uncharacterized protein n=1 Tax=Bugula neritina TaxID=10212 RepID=A0A7J7K6F8_BUGNE|nr:hypothetical protein EB796_007483 [Bugula neritina]
MTFELLTASVMPSEFISLLYSNHSISALDILKYHVDYIFNLYFFILFFHISANCDNNFFVFNKIRTQNILAGDVL